MRFAAISAAVLSLVAMSIAEVCVPECMTFSGPGNAGMVNLITCPNEQHCQTLSNGASGVVGAYYFGVSGIYFYFSASSLSIYRNRRPVYHK